MIKISHRGNIWGKDVDKENHPHYIEQALNLGFDCEIDVWYVNGRWMLGHDEPQYYVDISWIDKPNLWIHCKNKEAFQLLSFAHHTFWHENDAVALTTHGLFWTTHWDMVYRRTVIMCINEDFPAQDILNKIHGVCSDYIGRL